ncbi:pyridoxal phosphate-dependent aminotransferase [Luteipulveratus halotolerans]|uniref:Aminotransferase class I/classII large domain-containing protein n=1 Tax=Luteipulveratus halotolerans TaxID=1631356 RepID=A0A0L6CLW9_9MICO|nr:pyridoxal phosphate-dependent aminotransferase [Luteipulveratus halotolerans]KNX38729.1 hypothetical protein VV01_18825 [Luteipulveratus halotolerans]
METYTIQEWLFREAAGRYDVDLAESGVLRQTVGDVEIDPAWDLDYTLDHGSDELRDALHTAYDPSVDDDVLVSTGGQEALYLLYRSALSVGDHVVTQSPGWQQAWAVPREIGCDVTAVRVTPRECPGTAMASAVNARTRMVVLTSPHNPLGTRISAQGSAELHRRCQEVGALLVVDEEYMHDYRSSLVHLGPGVLVVSSLSKMHGMPGLRTGWAIGPRDVIAGMRNYKRFTTVCNSVLCERIAARAVLETPRHLARFDSLHGPGLELLEDWVATRAEQLTLVEPQGTPFAWIELASGDADVIAKTALVDHRVLVMPESVFAPPDAGPSRALRVTFARPLPVLRAGLGALTSVLDDVRG